MRSLVSACALVLLLAPAGARAGGPEWRVEPGWREELASRGVSGVALVYDEQADRYLTSDRALADAPHLPASTFKLFNALVALETSAVKDEYEVLRWDGVDHEFEAWNRDHSLASGMRFSALWLYQEVARRAGPERMQAWIDRAGYGNRDLGGGIDRFWLDGKLRITPAQQIAFLRRLAAGTLPFSDRAQEAVRRIAIVEAAPGYVLYGKTGFALAASTGTDQAFGWFVGWVERAGRRWFYAVALDMPRGFSEAPKRMAVARAVLARAGALPAAPR